MTDTLLPTGRSLLVSNAARLIEALRAAGPPLLFGLRLWARGVARALRRVLAQLDNPFWAGTSAAIVCQPQLGASLRKGWFRLVGTVIGAAMSLVLVACFPQDRVLFLGCLTVWGAACAFAATLLRNFASYAAALAGYTVAIIAGDLFGSGRRRGCKRCLPACRYPGQRDLPRHRLRRCRSAPVTDLGGAGRQLAAQFADLSAAITAGPYPRIGNRGTRIRPTRSPFVTNSFVASSPSIPLIDQTLGESAQIRYHSPVLQSAVDGLFTALSGWRAIANLHGLPAGETRQEAADSPRKRAAGAADRHHGRTPLRAGSTIRSRCIRICELTVRRLIALPAVSPVAAPACRQGSRDLRRHRAGARMASRCLLPIRHDHYASRHQTVSGGRLAARAGQCRPRLRHHWRCCAVLDRHRVAGRRHRDDVRDDHRAVLAPRAEQAYGAAILFIAGIFLDVVLDRDRRVWGAAGTGDREVCRLQPRARCLPRAHGRPVGAGEASPGRSGCSPG